jgi:hypothetical protein
MLELIDKANNFLLAVKNHVMRFLRFEPSNKFYGFVLLHRDDFTRMSDAEFDKKYMRTQPWGMYHPDNLYQWYDPAATVLNSSGLNLHVTANVFIDPEKKVRIERGVGMVHGRKPHGYGLYEWNIRLPEGKLLWPAVWTACGKTWPPEIDVIEAYSDADGKYKNRLNTNVHLGSSGSNHYQVGANRHGWLVDHKEKLNLKCHWEKDFVKIYYNNFLVRVIRNKHDLSWLNAIPEQVVIMNAAIRGFEGANLPIADLTKKPFVVEDFSFYKAN